VLSILFLIGNTSLHLSPSIYLYAAVILILAQLD